MTKKKPPYLTLEAMIDLAEDMGDKMAWLSAEIKELPRYGDMCICQKPVRFAEMIGDTLAMRMMCLRCGGMVFMENV
jgi:hypothetical protein